LPLTGTHLLKLLKADFVADICGDSHMFGFNYLSFTPWLSARSSLSNLDLRSSQIQSGSQEELDMAPLMTPSVERVPL